MAKNVMMKEAKDIMKTGAVSVVGMGALGSLSRVRGMPPQAGNVARISGSALTLVNIGQLVKSGKNIAKKLKL